MIPISWALVLSARKARCAVTACTLALFGRALDCGLRGLQQARGELARGLQHVGKRREVDAEAAAAAHRTHAAARVKRERERAASRAALLQSAVGHQVLAGGGERHEERQAGRVESNRLVKN